jgi:flagellar basal-body rod modification protein FlgD
MTTTDTSNSLGNLTDPTSASTTVNSSAMAQLNQNDFLRLMTTQLTTQDPFNPVDNTQMVAQMAQFSQVAGISQMNQSLQQLVDEMGGSNRISDAASWIGRSMLVQSDIATPLRDGSYAGAVDLPDGADSVTINFVDANGQTVHTQSATDQVAGTMPFAWDGKDDDGNVVATGPLTVQVVARVNGANTSPTIATWTSIAGIQSPATGGATQLVTGLGILSPDDAIRLA